MSAGLVLLVVLLLVLLLVQVARVVLLRRSQKILEERPHTSGPSRT